MYGTALIEISALLEGHLGVLSSHVLQKGMEQGEGFQECDDCLLICCSRQTTVSSLHCDMDRFVYLTLQS